MSSHAFAMGIVRRWVVLSLVLLFGVAARTAGAQTFDDDLQNGFDPDATLEEPAWDDGETLDASDADPRALSDFRPYLDPYGDWYEDARFGLVWVPSRRVVGDDFAPYLSKGYWALDTLGNWVWVSNYPFGSVVFHYGRWVWVVGVGWAWVPGYRYAPAWVSWRVPTHYRGVYVGWAPLPPSYVWVDGVAVGVGFYVMTPWVFCPSYYVFSHHLYRHRVREQHRMREAAKETHPYPAEDGRVGPSPARANVPRSRVPTSRVAAQPVPSARRDYVLPSAVAPAPVTARPADSERPRVQLPDSAEPARSAPPRPQKAWPSATPSRELPRPLPGSTSPAPPAERRAGAERAPRSYLSPPSTAPPKAAQPVPSSGRKTPRVLRRAKSSSSASVPSKRRTPARPLPGTKNTMVPRSHAPSPPEHRTPQPVRR